MDVPVLLSPVLFRNAALSSPQVSALSFLERTSSLHGEYKSTQITTIISNEVYIALVFRKGTLVQKSEVPSLRHHLWCKKCRLQHASLFIKNKIEEKAKKKGYTNPRLLI